MATVHARQSVEVSVPAGTMASALLAFWAAMLPFDNAGVVGSFGSVTKLLAIVVALAVAADRILRGHGRVVRPGVHAATWGIFVMLAVASAIWSPVPGMTAGGAATLLGLYGFYVVVTLTPWSAQSLRRLETAVIIGGLAASVIALYLFGRGQFYTATERVSLDIGQERSTDPNHFAVSLILPFMFVLGRCFAREKMHRLNYVWTGIIGLAIALTGSRGGVLGAVCGSALLVWNMRKSTRRLVPGLIAVAVLLLAAAQTLPESLVQRYSIQTVLASGGSGRLPLWRVAIYAFEQRPFLGWGYDSFASLTGGVISSHVPWRVSFAHVAHNIYLQALSELGVLGLGVMITALVLHLLRATKVGREYAFFGATAAALFGVAVSSVTLGTLNYKYFWLLQMLAAITMYWAQPRLTPTQERSAHCGSTPLVDETIL